MTTMKEEMYTIDASGRTLGRVASEAAQALQGKTSVNFARNTVLPIKVVITNASKLMISDKRAKEKVYTRYTGFPGGLFMQTMKELRDKKGIAAVVHKTVDGMIPRNRLRKARMMNLTITD
jgi:large subunit ribosomal protein L13